MIKNHNQQAVHAAYTTPAATVIQFGSEQLLVGSFGDSGGGGGHTPAIPDPNGDIEGSRRKMFEYDFTFENSSDE